MSNAADDYSSTPTDDGAQESSTPAESSAGEAAPQASEQPQPEQSSAEPSQASEQPAAGPQPAEEAQYSEQTSPAPAESAPAQEGDEPAAAAAPQAEPAAQADGQSGDDNQTPVDSSSRVSAAPTINASIAIDPDDGTPQNPRSIQAKNSATLTLSWDSTGASSVEIDPLGDVAPSGSQQIPTKDAVYRLVAYTADGKLQSPPLRIEVHTHPDDVVMSPQADVHAGPPAIDSFRALDDSGADLTAATLNQNIRLVALISGGSTGAQIAGTPAITHDTDDGRQTAEMYLQFDGVTTELECVLNEGPRSTLSLDYRRDDGSVAAVDAGIVSILAGAKGKKQSAAPKVEKGGLFTITVVAGPDAQSFQVAGNGSANMKASADGKQKVGALELRYPGDWVTYNITVSANGSQTASGSIQVKEGIGDPDDPAASEEESAEFAPLPVFSPDPLELDVGKLWSTSAFTVSGAISIGVEFDFSGCEPLVEYTLTSCKKEMSKQLDTHAKSFNISEWFAPLREIEVEAKLELGAEAEVEEEVAKKIEYALGGSVEMTFGNNQKPISPPEAYAHKGEWVAFKAQPVGSLSAAATAVKYEFEPAQPGKAAPAKPKFTYGEIKLSGGLKYEIEIKLRNLKESGKATFTIAAELTIQPSWTFVAEQAVKIFSRVMDVIEAAPLEGLLAVGMGAVVVMELVQTYQAMETGALIGHLSQSRDQLITDKNIPISFRGGYTSRTKRADAKVPWAWDQGNKLRKQLLPPLVAMMKATEQGRTDPAYAANSADQTLLDNADAAVAKYSANEFELRWAAAATTVCSAVKARKQISNDLNMVVSAIESAFDFDPDNAQIPFLGRYVDLLKVVLTESQMGAAKQKGYYK